MLLFVAMALAEPPPVVAGDYEVSTLVPSEGADPVDFALHMHHEAMATGETCYTVKRGFGFGPVPEGEGPHRPAEVTMTETITCTQGGLGTYHASAVLVFAASWSGEGQTVLTVPGGTVTTRMTKVQTPRDVGAPALWVGQRFSHIVPPGELTFDAKALRRGRRPELTLTWEGTTYQLEPVEDRR